MALSASDLPTIFSLLSNSLSGDESIRKPAESALAQCESRPGFCSCLMVTIFLYYLSIPSLGFLFVPLSSSSFSIIQFQQIHEKFLIREQFQWWDWNCCIGRGWICVLVSLIAKIKKIKPTLSYNRCLVWMCFCSCSSGSDVDDD